MGCCGKEKTVHPEGIGTTVKQIAIGYTNLFRGKKYEFTDNRIRICQTCDQNYWIRKMLWCSICRCYIPAAARVEDKKCPLGKW